VIEDPEWLAADRSRNVRDGVPDLLQVTEVLPMSAAEEDRLYRRLGRLIAASVPPAGQPGLDRPGPESTAVPARQARHVGT